MGEADAIITAARSQALADAMAMVHVPSERTSIDSGTVQVEVVRHDKGHMVHVPSHVARKEFKQFVKRLTCVPDVS